MIKILFIDYEGNQAWVGELRTDLLQTAFARVRHALMRQVVHQAILPILEAVASLTSLPWAISTLPYARAQRLDNRCDAAPMDYG